MNLLLVEDDEQLGQATARALVLEDQEVTWVKSVDEAESRLSTLEFDVIVLDLGLPGRSGLELLQDLRKNADKTPVLILTARDSIDDRVRGLDFGADDYMTKPFEFTELLARLRALTRRSALQNQHYQTCGEIILNTASRNVSFQDQTIDLARREYVLLKYFMDNVGRVLTKQQIESKLYGWGTEVASNTVEVHVHNLRKKFGSVYIRTLRGVGYMLVSPATAPTNLR